MAVGDEIWVMLSSGVEDKANKSFCYIKTRPKHQLLESAGIIIQDAPVR